MRNFAVINSVPAAPPGTQVEITLDGIAVRCGIVHTPEPGGLAADAALIRKKAFSLNYRDRRLMLQAALAVAPGQFYTVGSEFAGEVVAIGSNVRDLAVGDRVIGNGNYPHAEAPDVRPGLPTNHGSKEFQALHASKLMRAPDSLTDDVAAAFAVGAQTAYSMIRRLELQSGAKVLVTAARSNTSLFAIQALRHRDVRVFACTTSTQAKERLLGLGVESVLQPAEVSDVSALIGGFDAVIDPFLDLYLPGATEWMRHGARYITCGIFEQTRGLAKQDAATPLSRGFDFASLIVKNLVVMGNCLGTTEDLKAALDDFDQGRLSVTIDSVFGHGEERPFLERSFHHPDRFGKVVYRYV